MSSSVKTDHLEHLGSGNTKYEFNGPHATFLERFDSPFWNSDLNRNNVVGTIEITAPEFTSLCPKTGQPDFATIVVKYQPRAYCVESKSFKLYLGSYRNVGEFHESCVNRIANDLVTLLDPTWLTVQGRFTPRGGIPFWPTADYVLREAAV